MKLGKYEIAIMMTPEKRRWLVFSANVWSDYASWSRDRGYYGRYVKQYIPISRVNIPVLCKIFFGLIKTA